MRIVKLGNLRKNRIWEATCHYCGSQMEAEERELSTSTGLGEWEKCLLCKKEVKFFPTDKYEEPTGGG